MTQTYQVTITLSDETLLALQANGFVLYGFATVASFPPPEPLVWFRTTEFRPDLVLAWTDSYAVYTGASQPVAGSGMQGLSAYPLQPDLGQTLTVESPAGIGMLSNQGQPGTVTVMNNTSTRFTCGLALPAPTGGGSPQPICALPLFGNNEVVMTPQPAIFLMFNTMPADAGAAITRTSSEGVLIHVTPASPTAALSYDINASWAGGGTVYPPGSAIPASAPGGDSSGG